MEGTSSKIEEEPTADLKPRMSPELVKKYR